MSKPPNTLEKLAAYNCWANEVLVHSLESLSAAVPASSLHLLSHISNAQLIWLSRIENMGHAPGVFDDHDLPGCREILVNTSDQLLELAAMPATGLSQVIRYVNSKGEIFDTPVKDILIHVFNHGTYHRAQIARDLRQNAFDPVNTDYITYVRALAISAG
jgi:uncharacterized damage-inducible protein DinB